MQKKIIILLLVLLSGHAFGNTAQLNTPLPVEQSEISTALKRLSDHYGYVLYMSFYRQPAYRATYDSVIRVDISARSGKGHNEFTFTQLLSAEEKENLLNRISRTMKPGAANEALDQLRSWCIAFNQFEAIRELYTDDVEALPYVYLSSEMLKEKLVSLGMKITRGKPESLESAMVYFYHFEVITYISTLSEDQQLDIYADLFEYVANDH